MTKEEIIRMARESGFHFLIDDPVVYAAHEHLAALHAEHEREECAKVCESYQDALDPHKWPNGYDCAAAIRARREK